MTDKQFDTLTPDEQLFYGILTNAYNGITQNICIAGEIGWNRAKAARIAGQLRKKGLVEIFKAPDSLDGNVYEMVGRKKKKQK